MMHGQKNIKLLSCVRQFYKFHELLLWNLSKMDVNLHRKKKKI